MKVRVYLIIEQGSDRVYVQTTYPTWYEPPTDKGWEVAAADIDVFLQWECRQTLTVTEHQAVSEHLTVFEQDARRREEQRLGFTYGNLASTSRHMPSRLAFEMLAMDRGWTSDQFERWAKDRKWLDGSDRRDDGV